ncbi:MAG: hypothetical protein P8P30_09085 [Rickettsiales bacterium]|nr:hypothetical protein [Rickettsiales bacterium]
MEDPFTEYERLFRDYVKICNRALTVNKDIFPFKHIWNAAEAELQNGSVKIIIYDDEPKMNYSLRLQNNKIDASACSHIGKDEPWYLNTSYLRRVVEHPDEYIDNPAMIDWDWLKAAKL